MIRLESNTSIVLGAVGNCEAFPIPSIPGVCAADRRNEGSTKPSGWVTRKLERNYAICHVSPIDAINGGFAIEIDQLAHGLGLVDGAMHSATTRVLEETCYDLSAQVAKLERDIGKLNDKIARMKRYAKRG